jgi:B12-binding domain/radical SAM domain protein
MLNVLAVTAPHWVAQKNTGNSLSLNSREPYSLYNAVRYAAYLAQTGIGEWGHSNWKTKEGCGQSIMLYEYFENQKQDFINMLTQVKPNLVLIGTMTIGFPGAIEVAKITRQFLGDDCFIVVGGKHIIETTYLSNGEISANGNCCLNLMRLGKVPKVFDLVLAGDGEEVIVEIGNLIGTVCHAGNKQLFYAAAASLQKANGVWLAGWLDENNAVRYVQSNGTQIDYDKIPSPLSLFDLRANFPIFQSDITSHTYSYMSKGCVYNCFFCSEKNAINGKLQQKETAPQRLFAQFMELHEYAKKNGLQKASAFVEDSILLAGNPQLLHTLNDLLSVTNLNLVFGGQITSDFVLDPAVQDAIIKLSYNGLSYLFIGLETNKMEIASQMSKNTNRKTDWLKKNEQVLQFLSAANIKCGFSVLFGLGESQQERIALFKKIEEWQGVYGTPHVISLNYATQHPLKNYELSKHDYIDWGTSIESPLLPIFTQLFGEASEKYIMPQTTLGNLEEFEAIQNYYLRLNLKFQ